MTNRYRWENKSEGLFQTKECLRLTGGLTVIREGSSVEAQHFYFCSWSIFITDMRRNSKAPFTLDLGRVRPKHSLSVFWQQWPNTRTNWARQKLMFKLPNHNHEATLTHTMWHTHLGRMAKHFQQGIILGFWWFRSILCFSKSSRFRTKNFQTSLSTLAY